MAGKSVIQPKEVVLKTCGECRWSFEPHERNYKGEFFRVKCPFSNRSRFMTEKQCERYADK